MARTEKKITTVEIAVIDDFDGKPLPEDTTPVRLTHDGKTYELYLSDANRKKLVDTLDKFTKNAQPVTAPRRGRTKSRSSSSSTDFAAIREWAKENGHEVSSRGRIRSDVVEAYHAAQ